MGNGRSMTIYPWLTVYQTAKNGFYSIAEIDSEETNNEVTLIDQEENAEIKIIKKDLIRHLSRDAKQVIIIIFNNEEDFKNDKQETISVMKIKSHLAYCGWQKKKISAIFRELKRFLNDLSEIN